MKHDHTPINHPDPPDSDARPPLELWGGMECSLVRVRDAYHDQFTVSGHWERADTDLEHIAALGIRTLRYPISWERVCPDGDLSRADWQWQDARMAKLRDLGIRPIATLVHHGSGPRYTNLTDPCFPEKLAQFARAAAQRYPWVTNWTPVNEPLTTARFSGLYGHWYPHGQDEATFSRCLLGEIKGTVLAMRAIREITPTARLVQTEDLGRTGSTPTLAYQAQFENERRWISFDLLCGRVDSLETHRMWGHLRGVGIHEDELCWLRDNPCPPDVFGINHYLTSERFLDERLERYPSDTYGGNGQHRYADVEAVRVLEGGCPGTGRLLAETWKRYARPVAITEAHLGCTREEQMRWLADIWQEAQWARTEQGADVQAVTVWSLFGAWDWDSLLTQQRGHYEPGVWDTRALPEPRPTGLWQVAQALATTGHIPEHPALAMPGWWHRPERILFEPAVPAMSDSSGDENTASSQEKLLYLLHPAWGVSDKGHPLLITGGRGMLAGALRRACDLRGLNCHVLTRDECDITSIPAIEDALRTHHPWAVLNAAGYVHADLAELERFECYRDNFHGPALLAAACAKHGIPLTLFSSGMVFEGTDTTTSGSFPGFSEDDNTHPVGVYARSKVAQEEAVRRLLPSSLIIRSSALFGPWDGKNFLTRALQGLALGQPVYAASDDWLTPAYICDFVDQVLDLVLDAENGFWHLSHPERVSRAEIIQRAACLADIDTRNLYSIPKASLRNGSSLHRPGGTVLRSIRSTPLLPSLESALGHYVEHARHHWEKRFPLPAPAQVHREAVRLQGALFPARI